MDRTLVLAKPDAVERGLAGEIVGRLERKGLRLVAVELRQRDEGTARKHYA
ncbi:MAG: nucleoside-diphosphate kinase, partial [Acidimicrobiales bacterium]